MKESEYKKNKFIFNPNYEHLAIINTNIGDLYLFMRTGDYYFSLKKSIDVSIKEVDPQEYLKKLITFVLYPKNELKEGKYKPDEPILTIAEINKLSGEELENIAKICIDNDTYLFETPKIDKELNEKGEVINSDYNDIEYSKKNEENYTQYLHRLSYIKDEEYKGLTKNLRHKLGGFSDSVSRDIENNLSAGEILLKSLPPNYPNSLLDTTKSLFPDYTKSFLNAANSLPPNYPNSLLDTTKSLFPDYTKSFLNAANSLPPNYPNSLLDTTKSLFPDYTKSFLNAANSLPPNYPNSLLDTTKSLFPDYTKLFLNAANSLPSTIEIQRPNIPSALENLIDTSAEIKKDEERRHREPFDNLAQHIVKLTKFTVESNETQKKIAAEIKNSGDKTAGLSEKTLWLTIIIIFLTVTIPICINYVENFSNEKQQDILNKILTSIDQSNENFTQNQQEIDKLNLKNLENKEQIKALTKEIEQLNNANEQ